MIMKKQIDGAVFRKLMMTNLVKKFPAFSVRWVLPQEVYQEYECTAKTMKITVLWYETPCSLAEILQRFGEMCCPPPLPQDKRLLFNTYSEMQMLHTVSVFMG